MIKKINLKAIRINENLTQKEMADKLKIPLGTYKRYEKSPDYLRKNADGIVLHRIAKITGFGVDDIFLGF